MNSKQRSAESYFLVFFLLIQTLIALYGGYKLMNDPSGESLHLSREILKGSIFNSFLIPGILVFILLGIIPSLLFYPLIFKPRWQGLNKLNIYKNYHWSWTYTVYIAIVAILWSYFQMIVLNYGSALQGMLGLLATLILIVALIPSVKRVYRIRKHKNSFTAQSFKVDKQL